MNILDWWLARFEVASKNEFSRERGMKDIAKSGRREAFDIMVKGLDDSYQGVRVAAIQGLGATRDPRIVPLLSRLAEDPNQSVIGYQARQALLQLGDSAVSVFADLLGSSNREVRESAAAALEFDFSEQALRSVLPQMLAAFPKGIWNVRLSLSNAIGKACDPRAISVLADALHDDDENVRVRAIIALGRIADARAVEALRAFSPGSDREREVRQKTLRQLISEPS